MNRAILSLCLLAVALVLAACGAGGTDQTTSGNTSDGMLVTLTTNPAQPAVGNVELIVEVKDEGNRPVEGAAVRLKADMIGHTMGDLSGQATNQGNGRYAITANLSMAGEWKVDVNVAAPGKQVAREFRINVQ